MKSVEDMQVVILAGGLGTRLRPYTETIPKPMIDICGKPFLEHQLANIKSSGMKKILLCVGYLGEKIEEYFENGKNFGLNIKYSYEEKPLGTAGALKNAEFLIETNPFILMNGDTYSKINLRDLNDYHRKLNSFMTMAVSPSSNPLEQELVKIENEKLINFYQRGTEEHSLLLKKTQSPLISAGIYIFNKEILSLIPEGKCSLEKEIFPKIIDNINIFEYYGYFKDIANIQFCKELEQDIIGGRIK
jgi:NDP-sugar pyrophosphorylase family protein